MPIETELLVSQQKVGKLHTTSVVSAVVHVQFNPTSNTRGYISFCRFLQDENHVRSRARTHRERERTVINWIKWKQINI